MKKQIIILSTALAVSGIGAAVATTGITNAASAQTTTKTNFVRRIGGERAHVKLNQAERDGTITAAQKTAFLSEVKTLRQERKSVITKSSTSDQRQAERAKLKGELQSWSTTNNFPLAKLFPKLAA